MLTGKERKIRGFKPWRILLSYIALTVLCLLFIRYDMVKNVIDINGKFSAYTVLLVAKTLKVLNIPCATEGSLLKLPNMTLNVLFGCNGLEVVLMFSIGVLVYPAAWKVRLIGLTTGFLVIQVLNMARIVGLAFIGVYYKIIFEEFHYYFFGWLMVAITFGMFAIYSRQCEKHRQRVTER